MKSSEIIREAKNVLFERGWTRGRIQREDGSLCAIGALSVAAGHDSQENYVPFFDAGPLADSLRFLTDRQRPCSRDGRILLLSDVFGVNDRTPDFDSVLEWFDKAEKLAEAAEVQS